jgi:amino acid transporter
MLKKKITLFNGVAIAISMVVGSGLFGLPGLAIRETNPMTALLGWGLIVLLMPSLIYVFSWLGRQHPSSEGISLYASMGLGNWSRPGIMMITCGTLAVGMPAFFLVGGNYIAALLELDTTRWSVPCALLLAVVTTIINLRGVEKLGFINELVVILVLCVVAYISIRTLPSIPAAFDGVTVGSLSTIPLAQIWLAMSIVFWAFQGWENMTFGFDEIENPKVNIPLIYWISFALVSIIYIVFATAIFAGAKQGLNVSGLSGVAALLPGGMWGRGALVVMVFILVANANSWVFGSSRAFFSAAKLHLLPSSLSVLNAKGIPARMLMAALVTYSLVILTMWYFRIDEHYAFLLTTQGFIILYGGAVLAFMREAKRWWQWIIGLLAGASWVFLIQGFGWLILYPIGLMLMGVMLKFRHPVVEQVVQ